MSRKLSDLDLDFIVQKGGFTQILQHSIYGVGAGIFASLAAVGLDNSSFAASNGALKKHLLRILPITTVGFTAYGAISYFTAELRGKYDYMAELVPGAVIGSFYGVMKRSIHKGLGGAIIGGLIATTPTLVRSLNAPVPTVAQRIANNSSNYDPSRIQ